MKGLNPNFSEINPDYNSLCLDNNCMGNINEDNDVMHNDKSFVTLNNEHNTRAELKKLKGFRVGHINITSLPKHIEQLRFYLYDKSLDILSIHETRLDGSVDNNAIQLEGYNLARKDRSREGGGIAMYFRDHLNVKERTELFPDCIEAVSIEVIKIKPKPILVTTLYRPPNTQIEFFELNLNA